MCQKLDSIAGLLRTPIKAYNINAEYVEPLINSSMRSFHVRSFERPIMLNPDHWFLALVGLFVTLRKSL